MSIAKADQDSETQQREAAKMAYQSAIHTIYSLVEDLRAADRVLMEEGQHQGATWDARQDLQAVAHTLTGIVFPELA